MAGINTIPGLGVNVEYSTDGFNFRKIPFAGSFSTSGGDPNVIEGDTFDGPFKRVGNMRVPDATIEFPAYVPNHPSWGDLHAAAEDNNGEVTYRVGTIREEPFTASGVLNTVAIDTEGVATFAGAAPDFTSDKYAGGLVIECDAATRGTVIANTATVEHVYRATETNIAPNTPTGGATSDDFVPTGWSAIDIAPTVARRYVWRSTRTQTGGAWTAADFAAPTLFSSLAFSRYTIDTISEAGVVTVRPAPETAVAATSGYRIARPSLTKTFTARFRTPVHDNMEASGLLSSTLELALTHTLPQWEYA